MNIPLVSVPLPTGGSAIFGYARIAPQAGFEMMKERVSNLSITDAVVTSAAFFDDNQSLVSGQPARLIAAIMQRNAPSPSGAGAVMWNASPDMP